MHAADLALWGPRVLQPFHSVPAVLQRLRLHRSRVVNLRALGPLTPHHQLPSMNTNVYRVLRHRHAQARTARLGAALRRSTLRHCAGMEQQTTAACLALLRCARHLCWPCWRAAPAAAALLPCLPPPACLANVYSARVDPQRAARRRQLLQPRRARPAGGLPLAHLPPDLPTSSPSWWQWPTVRHGECQQMRPCFRDVCT